MNDLPTRRAYADQLDAVHDSVVALGEQTCMTIVSATRALLERDLDAARAVVDGDDLIDAATVDIEERCSELLVLQSPVAGDLRAVISALRVASEIERCGDLAGNIAKTARRLHDVRIDPVLLRMIEQMGDLAVRHLRFAVEAYADADEARAAALDDLDDELDELHRAFIEAIFQSRSTNTVDLRVGVQLALLGRYFERLGDHAVNVGERIRYQVSGWQPEYDGATRARIRQGDAPLVVPDTIATLAPPSGDADPDEERRRVEALRRDFVANIGHELRTPVGAMVVLAETIADEVEGLSETEAAATIQRLSIRLSDEASRLGRTIDDLLELSRIEAGEPPVRTYESVSDLLAAAKERTQPSAELAKVDVDVRGPEPDVSIAVDRRQLVSALTNLVDNAIKYSGPGDAVEVSADIDGGAVRFVVRDHGIGIPDVDQSRIFERFYRVDRARRRDTGGTGLGLAIVRHVALNHGGRVSVESVEGKGATFTLVVPRTGP